MLQVVGGTVTVLVNWMMIHLITMYLDVNGLDGHANGAKLHIKRIWWQVQGTVDDDDKNMFFFNLKVHHLIHTAINLQVQVTMMVLLD